MRTKCRAAARLRLRRHLIAMLATLPVLDTDKVHRGWAVAVLVVRNGRHAARAVTGFLAALCSALLVAPLVPRPKLSRKKSPSHVKLETPIPALFSHDPILIEFLPPASSAPLFSFEAPMLPLLEETPGEEIKSHESEVRDRKVVLALKLIGQGMSRRSVARELGVAESTLRNWLRKGSLVPAGWGGKVFPAAR